MQPPEKPFDGTVDYYIDRANYSRNFKKLLESEDVVDIITDTLAIYGSGKTTILANLYEDIRNQPAFNPMWMSLHLFSSLHLNPQLADLKDTVEVYAQNIVAYFLLIADLCETTLSESGDHRRALSRIALKELASLPGLEIDLDGDIDQWQVALHHVVGAQIATNATIPLADYREAVVRAASQITSYYL